MHVVQAATGTSLSEPTGPEAPPGRRGRYAYWVLVIAAGVLVADQITKAWAVATLEPGEPVEVFGELLQLNLVFNSGAAFSIAQGQTLLVTVVAAVVAVVIVRLASQLDSLRWALALGAMLGGALGNLTDRVFRAPAPFRGHVVDFIDVPLWPVFNLADIAVVGGAVGIAVLTLLGVDYRAEVDPPGVPDDGPARS